MRMNIHRQSMLLLMRRLMKRIKMSGKVHLDAEEVPEGEAVVARLLKLDERPHLLLLRNEAVKLLVEILRLEEELLLVHHLGVVAAVEAEEVAEAEEVPNGSEIRPLV